MKEFESKLDEGYCIDWEAVSKYIKETNGAMDKFIDRPSKFIKPIKKDSPKSIWEIRKMVNELIRENDPIFRGLIEIIEQIVMTLERPVATYGISPIIPQIWPPYTQPNSTPSIPYRPYIGDSPFPGSGTYCGVGGSDVSNGPKGRTSIFNEIESVPQADGGVQNNENLSPDVR